MILTVLALVVLAQSPSVPTTTPDDDARPAAISRAPARVITARAPPSLPDGPTRVVCTRERAMDTNIQRRVCRRVPVNSSERERMASDMMKDMQRLGALPND